MAELTPVQSEVLRALVDTAVPSLPAPDGEDPHGFWATPGSRGRRRRRARQAFLATLPEADQAGIAQLLDGLALLGFQHQGRAAREGMLGTAMALAPEAAVAISTLRGGALHAGPLARRRAGPQPVLAGSTATPARWSRRRTTSRTSRRTSPPTARCSRPTSSSSGRAPAAARSPACSPRRASGRRARGGRRDQRARLPPARGRGRAPR